MTASGGAEGVGRPVNQAVVTSLLAISAFNYVFMQTLLATTSRAAGDQVMGGLLATRRAEWLASTGDIGGFMGRGRARRLRAARRCASSAKTLRQAGLLIVSSTLVDRGGGLLHRPAGTCGIEGAYFAEAQGTGAISGIFAAWCDLREAVPYAFGYMMAAKVGPRASWPRSVRCGSTRRSTRSR